MGSSARWAELSKCWLFGRPVWSVPCLSLGSLLPGGPKNCSAPWQARKKKAVLCDSQNMFAEMCCWACQSPDPPHPSWHVFFFFLREQWIPFLCSWGPRCWHVLIRRQPRVLASELPWFNIVCVTHWLYIKALALAERNSGRLIN